MTGATSRAAVVTGESLGIGAATARLLAARGMRVVVNYLRLFARQETLVVIALRGTAPTVLCSLEGHLLPAGALLGREKTPTGG